MHLTSTVQIQSYINLSTAGSISFPQIQRTKTQSPLSVTAVLWLPLRSRQGKHTEVFAAEACYTFTFVSGLLFLRRPNKCGKRETDLPEKLEEGVERKQSGRSNKKCHFPEPEIT
jgi:hypothetical protein